MKKSLVILIILFSVLSLKAQNETTSMVGGTFGYVFIGASYCNFAPLWCDSSVYGVILKLICEAPYNRPDSVEMRCWNKDDSLLCWYRKQAIADSSEMWVLPTGCQDSAQAILYKVYRYFATVDFYNLNVHGYYAATQGCCRADVFKNVIITDSTGRKAGWTYWLDIPPPRFKDSSPIFNL